MHAQYQSTADEHSDLYASSRFYGSPSCFITMVYLLQMCQAGLPTAAITIDSNELDDFSQRSN